jgi:hypothetical protein
VDEELALSAAWEDGGRRPLGAIRPRFRITSDLPTMRKLTLG